jgi:hypothetical protein
MRMLRAIWIHGARTGTFVGLCLALLAADCGGRDTGSPTGPSGSQGPVVLHDSTTPPPPITETSTKSMSFGQRPTLSRLSLDDFISPATGSVRSLRWLGVYCEALHQNVRLPNAGADSFYITFYNDLGGFMDTNLPAISSATYPLAQVNERFVQSANLWCDSQSQPVPAAFYEYSLTLTQPVALTAGTRYWLGIQALIADSPSLIFTDTPCNRCITWSWRGSAVTSNGYGLNTAIANARIPFDFAFQVSQ